jgi:hypothetical protein
MEKIMINDNISDQTLDDYLEAGGRAYAALDGAIDGWLGGMKATHGESGSAAEIFLALEMALLQHAARIALFRKDKFAERGVTAKTFGNMAREAFREMSEGTRVGTA